MRLVDQYEAFRDLADEGKSVPDIAHGSARHEERRFYEKLREYLEDSFDLSKRQGNQGRALGSLMAIFQKIAASTGC